MKILFIASTKSGTINSIVYNQGESLRVQGVEIVYFPIMGRGIIGYLKSIIPLRHIIKNGKFDIIHAHYGFCGFLASIAQIGISCNLVVSLMGNDLIDYAWQPKITRWFYSHFCWKAVITKSEEMRKRVAIPDAIVIPNGVNLDVFKELNKIECRTRLGWNTNDIHVLFMGRQNDARKNWPLALAAVHKLEKTRCQNILLHPMQGFKNFETVYLYNAADVAVLPSFYEGSANVLKEAMACGCPVVAADMGDCRERLRCVEGCYVACTYDVDEFSTLLDKALMFQSKTNGRQKLIEDGIDDISTAKKLIKVYEDILK